MKIVGATMLLFVFVLLSDPARAQQPWILLYSADSPDASMLDQRHVIAPGESLSGILRQYYDGRAGLRSLLQRVVQDNPHAFQRGDPNRMIAGKTLILPQFSGPPTEPDAIYHF